MKKAHWLLYCIISALPLLLYVCIIAFYKYDAPIKDQLSFLSIFEGQWSTRVYGMNWDHYNILPRFIWYGLSALGVWSFKWYLLCVPLFAGVFIFSLWKKHKTSHATVIYATWLSVFVISIFCLLHQHLFLSILLVTLIFFVLSSAPVASMHALIRIPCNFLLCTLAFFCFAHGTCTWFAAAMVSYMRKRSWLETILYMWAWLMSSYMYFVLAQNAQRAFNLLELDNIIRIIQRYLFLLGRSLTVLGIVPLAVTLGGIILAFAISILVYVLINTYKQKTWQQSDIVATSCIVFGLASNVLIAVGRLNTNWQSSPRYMMISGLVVIGIILFVLHRTKRWHTVILGLLTIHTLYLFCGFPAITSIWQLRYKDTYFAYKCLQVNTLPSAKFCGRVIAHSYGTVAKNYDVLTSMEYIHPLALDSFSTYKPTHEDSVELQSKHLKNIPNSGGYAKQGQKFYGNVVRHDCKPVERILLVQNNQPIAYSGTMQKKNTKQGNCDHMYEWQTGFTPKYKAETEEVELWILEKKNSEH